MRGSKGPFLCFLLIPSHFGKISHQGDCGGANIRSVSHKEECGAVNLPSCASC
ncbi:hypothetical protein T4A_5775 [Trichinella pseudospiralis]|uniref:Uncharacterized protein n=1 Tax=Trichinella pseudospiralis TaxID=6337 RepID=A0A0V1ANR8_TRIPS|nr:hypothetical protein T4A_5775 [Trichinella pseudospiralis]